METQPLTVHGWTRLITDNGHLQIHVFTNLATGLITTGLVEYRATNGKVWGPITEAKPVA